jgi:hypothetical protein
MKIMAKNSSAILRETPHAPTTGNNHDNRSTQQNPSRQQSPSTQQKIEALAEMICAAGDQSTAALFVLMATIQHSNDPAAVANILKHFSFTRCGELNLYGMVDAQIATIESELLANSAALN